MSKKQGAGESSPENTSFWKEGFNDRLGEAISRIGSIKAVAALCGVVPETVSKWRDGHTKMPFEAAVAICRVAGLSLEWLAGDQVPANVEAPEQAIDFERLRAIIAEFVTAVRELELDPTPERFADAIVLAYTYFDLEKDDMKAAVKSLLKTIA